MAKHELSGREQQILGLLLMGFSVLDCARLFGTQPHTVRLQLEELMRKLGKRGRRSMLMWATLALALRSIQSREARARQPLDRILRR